MQIGLRTFSPATTCWLGEALADGELSRSALARELCRREGWLNAKGEPCAASARKALPRLASALGLPLPAPVRQPPGPRPPSTAAVPQPSFRGSIQRLGPLCLQRIDSAADRSIWHSMLDACHPLGIGRAPGTRVSYLLRSPRHGVLGGLSFVAAALRLPPRDRYIGWNWRARNAHLRHLCCNDRFLLLAGVRVPHLASHVLSRAAQQLRADWLAAAGAEPLLLETCVDAAYRGTSYLAAGWQRLAEPTAGRPPGSGAGPRAPKTVWLRPLQRRARIRLAKEPPRPPGAFPGWEPRPGQHWTVREFERSDHYDRRVRERLLRMAKAWDSAPGSDLPTVFPDRNGRDAAYRLLNSAKVTMDDILQPHRESTAERCALEGSVLLVQDTTTLNYSGLRDCTPGLGPLGGNSRGKDGMLVHAGLVLAEGGRALGVFWLRPWARLEELKHYTGGRKKESRRWLEGFEEAAVLGQACPGTRVVTVCDREGDIFALLRRQAARAAEAGLLVRSNKARQRQVLTATGHEPLERHMRSLEPLVRERVVRVAARGGRHRRDEREARTEVRAERVRLRAPRGRGEPVEMQAVLVSEPQPPPGEKGLEWLLLSSDGEATARDALLTVRRYERRWLIEQYFRVLKSGTRLLARRLREAASLESCLAFEAVHAWKVFDIGRMARDRPQAPARESFSAVEREVINKLLNVERILPPGLRGRPEPEDVRTTVVNLARLSGFAPSKRQPLPGDEQLWKAWKVLKPMVRWEEGRKLYLIENQKNP